MLLRQLLLCGVQLAVMAAALTVRTASGSHGHEAEAPVEEASDVAEPAKAIQGISLGDYRIRSYFQVDAQKSTVRFSLFASVKTENYRDAKRLVESHQEKIRDQIIMATRLAPLAVFQEPDLASFRRRVLLRLRRALPDIAFEDIYVTEFDLTIKSL